MATTPKGIYYPNNYNEIADIPEDMKKMAESIEEVFENTDSDLSDIKEEQTTQNNRLNSLEVDNTTNKSDILTNKQEINNIKTEQTEQNTNISTNATNIESLQEENENLKSIVAQLPQVTGQGTEITLENTIEAPFTIFDVEGNSEQETTTGKNLLPNNATTQTYFGITITKKDNGTLILNGTATDIIQLNLLNNKRNNTMLPEADIKYSLESGIYKLSGCTNGSSSTYKLDVWVEGAEGSKATCFNQEVQFTLDEEKIVSYLRLVVYSGATLNNVVIKPMVRLASVTDDTYEPYTGGIASPNPNYEQPIESAGDNENLCDGINQEYWLNTTTLIAGKLSGNTGLIIPVDGVSKYTISTKIVQTRYRVACIDTEISSDGSETAYNGQSQDNTNNSITIDTTGHNYLLVNATSLENIKIEKGNKATPYSPYGMGSINEKIQTRNLFNKNEITENYRLLSDGSLYADNLYVTGSFIKVLPNTNYVFNKMAGSECICEYDKNKNCTGRTIMGSGSSITTKADTYYVRISVQKSKLDIFQYEPGSTATTYVPHKEQDYPIFVQQPMRSIGDVRDKFVKVNGNWFERHYIGRKIFDGTESWTSQQNCFTLSINDIKPTPNYSDRNQLITISNYYIGQVSGYRDAVNDLHVCKALDTGNPRQVAIKDTSKTLAEFKAWLAEKYANGNPVYVDYLLAEPLDLPCTEEQIEALENKPSTYKDFTIIQSQDETPAYLEVSGIRDINTMFDKVTNAIVSLGGNV